MQFCWLLIGNDFLLGNKIERVLKRKKSIIGVPYQELFEVENLIELIILKKVRGVIIESECLIATDKKDYMQENIKRLVGFCRKRKIECKFVWVKYPIEYDIDHDIFQKYCIDCNNVIHMVETVYVVHSIYESKNVLIQDGISEETHCTDVVALYIEEHLNQHGKMMICNEMGINEKEVINHQERCILKLIYELKAQDYFHGNCVAEMRVQMGEKLAEVVPKQVAEKLDYVCPVPHTGTYYAMGLARALNISYMQALLKSDSKERSFQIVDADERKKFLWAKLQPIKELIRGRTLALVDEAIFTGATLKVAVEMLHECNVKGVYICIPTPKCRNRCNYLVHPPRAMLLERIKDTMLEVYFNVDGVFFQQDETFKNIMNAMESGMCNECFFGGDGDE